MPGGASRRASVRRREHARRQARRRQARGDAARREAPQDGQMAEGVVEGAEGAGEHELVGAAAQRLVDGHLSVGAVLAHRVADQLDARRVEAFHGGRRQRVEVTDHHVGADPVLEQEARAAVGGDHEVGGLCPAAVERGLLVLAVEKDDGEATCSGTAPTPSGRRPRRSRPRRAATPREGRVVGLQQRPEQERREHALGHQVQQVVGHRVEPRRLPRRGRRRRRRSGPRGSGRRSVPSRRGPRPG